MYETHSRESVNRIVTLVNQVTSQSLLASFIAPVFVTALIRDSLDFSNFSHGNCPFRHRVVLSIHDGM